MTNGLRDSRRRRRLSAPGDYIFLALRITFNAGASARRGACSRCRTTANPVAVGYFDRIRRGSAQFTAVGNMWILKFQRRNFSPRNSFPQIMASHS